MIDVVFGGFIRASAKPMRRGCVIVIAINTNYEGVRVNGFGPAEAEFAGLCTAPAQPKQ